MAAMFKDKQERAVVYENTADELLMDESPVVLLIMSLNIAQVNPSETHK